MKKLCLTLISYLIFSSLYAQDTIRINHTNYTTVFSKSKKYPVMVEWWSTKKKVNCKKPLLRKDNFGADPKLLTETNLHKDYLGSGLDRGHMMPADDNLCQTEEIQNECFYYSNISPQYRSLNSGDWKSLEEVVRKLSVKLDSIHVWCGNVGEIKKIGTVSVPKYCWKVIYIKKNKEWLYFLFDNSPSKSDGLKNNQVDSEIIKEITGFTFK